MKHVSPFEFWLRTGRRKPSGPGELKFNPWHDPDDGRFTFAGQGKHFGRGGVSEAKPPPTARRTWLPPRAGPSVQSMQAQLERIDREARERDAFKTHIVPEEGDRNVVYVDTTGNATVGIGHKVTESDGLRPGDRITDAQKEAFWRADADKALRAARAQMRAAGITDQSFLLPLASVNFQLGPGWKDKFVKTWSLISARRYGAAAREAEDSKWFREDTPDRVRAFQAALTRLERAEQGRRQAQRRVPRGNQ